MMAHNDSGDSARLFLWISLTRQNPVGSFDLEGATPAMRLRRYGGRRHNGSELPKSIWAISATITASAAPSPSLDLKEKRPTAAVRSMKPLPYGGRRAPSLQFPASRRSARRFRLSSMASRTMPKR